MYDKRETITREVETIIREQMENKVFKTPVRINTKYKSTPIERQTIFQYEADTKGRGSEDYQAVTQEVADRLMARGFLGNLNR